MIKFNNLDPKGDIFDLFFNNPLTVNSSKKMKSKMDGVIFIRITRTGIIGQAIFDECWKDCSKYTLSHFEQIASICELYIFYLRSVYDYLMNYLQTVLGTNFPSSYHKFIKQVENKKYHQLSKNFSKLLLNGKVRFMELKNLRDSIKNKPSTVLIFSKNNKLYIEADFFSQDKASSSINEEVSKFVLRHSFTLHYLMLFIYSELRGKLTI
jgi:hypothetical protein